MPVTEAEWLALAGERDLRSRPLEGTDMANITEEPLPRSTAKALKGAVQDGLCILKLNATAEPQTVIEAIDAFVDAWQLGKRPSKKVLDPEDAPYALGSLWGEQLVRQFGWEWGMITFHDHDDSMAPGVLSPDRALAVYPIHFLLGCLQDPDVDCTVALSFNMLAAGNVGKLKPKKYLNLMDSVHRIIPKR
jgi:hypothetical protein